MTLRNLPRVTQSVTYCVYRLRPHDGHPSIWGLGPSRLRFCGSGIGVARGGWGWVFSFKASPEAVGLSRRGTDGGHACGEHRTTNKLVTSLRHTPETNGELRVNCTQIFLKTTKNKDSAREGPTSKLTYVVVGRIQAHRAGGTEGPSPVPVLHVALTPSVTEPVRGRVGTAGPKPPSSEGAGTRPAVGRHLEMWIWGVSPHPNA